MTLLSVSGLRKSYGGAVALRDVSLDLGAGETLALVGENGAGKSTLIRILAGATSADGGEIRLDGTPARVASPGEAHRRGLRFIHQELNVVGALSVAENIFLGRAYPRRFGLVNWRALHARAGAALERLGVAHVAPRTPIARLSVGDQMLVKIAAAFLDDETPPRIFVMDEPTAALNARECERLFGIVAALKAQACGVIYVSHRLDEVLRLADRIAVLRDGRTCATLACADADQAKLVELMTGREAGAAAGRTAPAPDAPARLKVEGLSADGLHDVSFEVGRGEILGFAGLAGAGQERLTRALVSGAGRVTLAGQPIRLAHPADAWARGLAIVPRERRAEGLLLTASIADNVALPHLSRFARARWFADRRGDRRRAVETGARVRLKASGPQQKTRALSGGNQQKVLFARAVAAAPAVLLLDEPTRGVDVGAKFDLYALLNEIAAAGTAVVMVSSDHEELLRLCARIAVMREGRLATVAPAQDLDPQRLLTLCYGETLA